MESINRRRPITRTRTGCHPCRRRRLKCDEGKPICRACSRSGLNCDFQPRFVFRDDTASIRERVIRTEQEKWDAIREIDGQSRLGSSRRSPRTYSRSSPASPAVVHSDSYLVQASPRADCSNPSLTLSSDTHVLDGTTQDGRSHEGESTNNDRYGQTSKAVCEDARIELLQMEQDLVPIPEQDDSVHVQSDHCPDSRDGDNPMANCAALEAVARQPIRHNRTESLASWPSPDFTNLGETGALQSGESPAIPGFYQESSSDQSLELDLEPVTLAYYNHRQPPKAFDSQDLSDPDLKLPIDPSKEAWILRQWRLLLPRLPPAFSQIDSFIRDYEVVKFAAFALATSGIDRASTDTLNPSTSKRYESLAYYSHALKIFATGGLNGVGKIEICARLAVLIQFIYFELGSGTVYGRICHLRKFDDLVLSDYDEIMQSTMGTQLVIIWAGLRAQHVADTVPFYSGGFPTLFERSTIQADVDRLIKLTSSTYPLLTSCLSTVSRASDLLLLMDVVGADSSNPIYRKWISLMTQLGHRLPRHGLFTSQPTELLRILQSQRERLDEWEASLPLTERPVERFSSHTFGTVNKYSHLQVHPLQFTTHEAAMNYLLYCCVQLYAASTNEFLGTTCWSAMKTPDQTGNASVNPWVLLTLRVAAGLDIQACLFKNIYHIGVTWILERVALRCCSLEVLTWIDDYLRKMEAQGVYEGGVPIALFRRAVTNMIGEWKRGRVVNLIYTSWDQFHEKEELCKAGTKGIHARAVLHGTVWAGEGNGSKDCRPFVDVVENF
ncbi:hypothetical protein BGZ61DRAFT_559865 [Ilyonectria robusta]|uniref:uncharacterized protein n=1 Tax=Ilyonectria robusta TaxID=1079257 RepID=UPI001E8E4CB8|nr:uncharacterized protein BGZ61DRAFT_559865 [Ilyonectria robusta]KAH8734288.1 hypothetical protein BGZ61DRAFT_559865 [Ilyonectria robusta]